MTLRKSFSRSPEDPNFKIKIFARLHLLPLMLQGDLLWIFPDSSGSELPVTWDSDVTPITAVFLWPPLWPASLPLPVCLSFVDI